MALRAENVDGLDSVAPSLWATLGGVMRLQDAAFVEALHVHHPYAIAAAIVLLAGLSEAAAQSIVLFANRISPARFALSLITNTLLFAFGYLVLVASTFAIFALPGAPHVSFDTLLLVFAFSYAPRVFTFWAALPYVGNAIQWALRVWHLLAMVVGVAAVAHLRHIEAFVYVAAGWLLMIVVQHTFGRPVATFGARCLDAVAGTTLAGDERSAIERSAPATLGAIRPSTGAASHNERLLSLIGAIGVVALALIVTLTLLPLRDSLDQLFHRVPLGFRLPFDLIWLGLAATLVAGFLAPAETLGWWAGWYGETLAPQADADALDAARARGVVSRYVVYLDGISQSSSHYTSDIETFLDAFAPRLPEGMRLIRGLMVYSVLNRPLDSDPIFAGFWKFVDAIRLKDVNSLLGMFVNLRNVLIVAVSADDRYGPLYNFGIARLVYDALIADGYDPHSGVPVTLIGYSGGGQMAAASAPILKHAIDAPIDVISLGGVMSGNSRFLDLEQLHHLIGSKDHVQVLGPIMFPSRWKICTLSYWNRAVHLGRITFIPLGPVGHQVPGGMLDPQAVLADGRTNLGQTLDFIDRILRGRMPSAEPAVRKPSNYDRYLGAAWNLPENYPIGAAVDEERYRPIGTWMGRLILPTLDERSQAGGVWFEVHHADAPYGDLVGQRVRLSWSDDPTVQALVRAVTRDVQFSAEADYANRVEGLVMPVRLDGRRLVDPLESLAGAHPRDDVVVMLSGPVEVRGAGAATELRIECHPVQITGRYYGLLRFAEALGDGRFRVAHFNRTSRAFDGPEEIVLLPDVVTDCDGRAPSSTRGLERMPLNADGWYAYGAPDRDGTFVVRALAPRALLRLEPEAVRPGTYRAVRDASWSDIVARKGTVRSLLFGGRPSGWSVGDKALLVHVYGGIGGAQREQEASSFIYFGHFAYGLAEVVLDPLAGEPRFEIVYHQIYTQNGDGLIAGALHWSRYMGDRQFGWSGLRPVCDLLLNLDAFDEDFSIDAARQTSALTGLVAQLEAMSARYRIGDGTGGTFAGPANNCAQDANHALFSTLRQLQAFIETHPGYDQWTSGEPADAERYRVLVQLTQDLSRSLQPFGSPRHDWSANEFNLGSTLQDAPMQCVLTGLMSWRVILPRLAADTILGAFLRHGASVWLLGTDQIGGEHPEIEPVAPTTLF
jgi:predicted Abi (CAAX) family protease